MPARDGKEQAPRGRRGALLARASTAPYLGGMAKHTKTSRSRPSALVRAEHGGAPVHLNVAEQKVFGEALRMGADLADELEAKVSAFGRWLLQAVFANDAAAALDDKTKNPVWQELVRGRRADPRLSKHMLYVAVRLAAYDKRITDQTWRGLDPGRKELLLPLREDKRLREAAQHVSKFNLTQTKTTAYVSGLLAEEGEPAARAVDGPGVVAAHGEDPRGARRRGGAQEGARAPGRPGAEGAAGARRGDRQGAGRAHGNRAGGARAVRFLPEVGAKSGFIYEGSFAFRRRNAPSC